MSKQKKSMYLNKKRKRIKKGPVILVGLCALLLLVSGVSAWQTWNKGETILPLTSDEEKPQVLDDSDKQKNEVSEYDIDTPASITAIINKQRPFPSDYEPSDLVVPNIAMRDNISGDEQYVRAQAATALEAMTSAAANEGIALLLGSGYRSYALQESLFASYEEISGTEAANQYSARAGQSEHQTGLAVDLVGDDMSCYLEICFEETPTGQWLESHAHEYGFILRFKKGKESITGYQYEPWHFRYVGPELAKAIHEKNVTMEEYFDLVQG